jgi:molybdopterin-guanine dinucleotide biosynthesis protein A
MTLRQSDILGVVLAGGEGRRMGFVNKPLMEIGGRTVLSHILERLQPQLGRTVINAKHPPLYTPYGLDVVPDQIDTHLGPLAGVLAALDWASLNVPKARYVMSLPGDAPFIPLNLVSEMTDAVNNTQGDKDPVLARAVSKKRAHPVVGLWPVAIRADLRDSLFNREIRKIDAFTANYRVVDVTFEGVPDPFFNINTKDDLALADRICNGRQ